MSSWPGEMIKCNSCENSLHGVAESACAAVKHEPGSKLTEQTPLGNPATATQLVRQLIEVKITYSGHHALQQARKLYLEQKTAAMRWFLHSIIYTYRCANVPLYYANIRVLFQNLKRMTQLISLLKIMVYISIFHMT